MVEHPLDLGMAADAVDLAHQLLQGAAVGDPARCPAFAETAEIDELDVEAAERGRGAEHVGLDALGLVPGLPPAGGGIHGEDQPRSEEHTSELQSLMRISYAVFCLKKKNRNKRITHTHY